MMNNAIMRPLKDTKGVLKKNYLVIVLAGVFIFGILLGSWGIAISEQSVRQSIALTFENYYAFITDSAFFDVFFNTFLSFFVIMLISYLAGLCALGNFINFPIIFFMGFGTGLIAGHLYYTQFPSGVSFFAVVILPALFLFSVTLILWVKQSFNFSVKFWRVVLGQSTGGLLGEFKIYSLKFLVFAILTTVCALLNSVMAVSFSGFFNFS